MAVAVPGRTRTSPAILAGQLSIWDELDARVLGPLHRLGEGRELGELLLQPLILKGWRLYEFAAFAGEGRVYVLELGGVEVRRTGKRLADVAVELCQEAAGMTPWDGDRRS